MTKALLRLRHLNAVFFLVFVVGLFKVGAQTLIINEVSNGPTANQEFVEFVVADLGLTYDCAANIPPCVDIRGWIFDDNSGYHVLKRGSLQ